MQQKDIEIKPDEQKDEIMQKQKRVANLGEKEMKMKMRNSDKEK